MIVQYLLVTVGASIAEQQLQRGDQTSETNLITNN